MNIEFNDIQTVNEIINTNKLVLVNMLSDNCISCETFKQYLPEVIELGNNNNIKILNINLDETNKNTIESWIKQVNKNKISIPGTFMFYNGAIISGGSILLNKDAYIGLINSLNNELK